ncbi:hypothetical protein ACJQWK_10213 [Exserohilum turcicum]
MLTPVCFPTTTTTTTTTTSTPVHPLTHIHPSIHPEKALHPTFHTNDTNPKHPKTQSPVQSSPVQSRPNQPTSLTRKNKTKRNKRKYTLTPPAYHAVPKRVRGRGGGGENPILQPQDIESCIIYMV